MKQNNTDRILIDNNEQGYQKEKEIYESVAAQLQNIVLDYEVLGLPSLNLDEFISLIEKPVDFVFDKMTNGQEVSIAGLKVDKSKAIEILQKPQGYEALMDRVNSIHRNGVYDRHHHERVLRVHEIKEWFDLKEGKVILNAKAENKLREKHRAYATSERAIKMLQFAKSIVAKVDELGIGDIFKHDPDGFTHILKHILQGGDGKPVEINIKGILRYNEAAFTRH